MIKVSHEVPIPYLKQSRSFNDYDYCLPHLLDESKEYKQYFVRSKEMHRYIIMDNSLHELGKPYDSNRLWHWMNYFKPNEFIVPDYWQDKTATLVAAKSWLQRKYPKETTPVAVVQASNKPEAWECYNILKTQGYKKIAFSYGADWYYDEGLSTTPDKNNKWVTKAHGRYNIIKDFYEKGLIRKFDRIHLLGCNIPQEFSWYKDMPFIESVDTSNPVIHGLAGVKYKDYGLDEKLPHKVDKFEGDSENWETALYNVEKFREFIPKK
jgi:hypothetical protein